jgi:hypothetical protein
MQSFPPINQPTNQPTNQQTQAHLPENMILAIIQPNVGHTYSNTMDDAEIMSVCDDGSYCDGGCVVCVCVCVCV